MPLITAYDRSVIVPSVTFWFVFANGKPHAFLSVPIVKRTFVCLARSAASIYAVKSAAPTFKKNSNVKNKCDLNEVALVFYFDSIVFKESITSPYM